MNRSRETLIGEFQLPRRREDRQLYQQAPVSMGLELSAARAVCTVVRADIEKPTSFLAWGNRKGKLANCEC